MKANIIGGLHPVDLSMIDNVEVRECIDSIECGIEVILSDGRKIWTYAYDGAMDYCGVDDFIPKEQYIESISRMTEMRREVELTEEDIERLRLNPRERRKN